MLLASYSDKLLAMYTYTQPRLANGYLKGMTSPRVASGALQRLLCRVVYMHYCLLFSSVLQADTLADSFLHSVVK